MIGLWRVQHETCSRACADAIPRPFVKLWTSRPAGSIERRAASASRRPMRKMSRRRCSERRRSHEREDSTSKLEEAFEKRFDANGSWLRLPVEADRLVESPLVSTGSLDDAPLSVRLAVRLHLSICRHYRAFKRSVEALARD